jgi:hypothetical protein
MSYDEVNHPSHYNEGRAFEVIEVLEDWAGRAPDPVLGGLQWSCLKYQGRVWDKADPLKDLRKSRWYLDRLISKLENAKQDSVITYEDVLEDYAASAADGTDSIYEYAIYEDNAQLLPDEQSWNDIWSDSSYETFSNIQLTDEEINSFLDNENLITLKDGQAVAVIEKEGALIRINKDRSYYQVGRLWSEGCTF